MKTSPTSDVLVRLPETTEQSLELKAELAVLDRECHVVVDLIRAVCGPADARTIRAEEVINALQRLHWAFDRNRKSYQLTKASRA